MAGGPGLTSHKNWVPLDTDEGVVKANLSSAVREHRFSEWFAERARSSGSSASGAILHARTESR